MDAADRELLAAAIEAELVCCDIYQRMEDLMEPGPEGTPYVSPEWSALRASSDFHSICYYGSWSAAIVRKTQLPGEGSLAQALIHANPDGTHRYLGTYCQPSHPRHEMCKLVCKTCSSPCVCACHAE